MKKILKNDFPPLLKEISDPPPLLYIEGDLPDATENKYLAVVGARKNSNYGKEVCQKLISGLKGWGVVIVSGLAIGIDSIAHETALDAGLKTVAVPGSGLNEEVLYPASNRNLAKKILESDGALMSEFEPNFRATPYSFPQRNRIMAGISHAVLVIEAEKKSGTLITARLAVDYNREVLTVPGSIFSKTSEGPHYLIRNGATPITESKDILEALGFATENIPKNLELEMENCSPEEKKILNMLNEPRQRDELIRKMALPPNAVNALISMLEIKGLISERGGEIRTL